MFEHKRFGFARAVMNALKLMGPEAELDFVAYVRDVTKTIPKAATIYDTSCRLPAPAPSMPRIELEIPDDRTPLKNCRCAFPNSGGTPFPGDVAAVVPRGPRDVLREQSELIAKYAAHCEAKASTCSTVATLVDYSERAKLARDIALIYFRAATLEV